jgi:hypothetical protein
MADWLSLVKSKASREIPGAEYNAFRTQTEASGEIPSLYYEIELTPEREWTDVRDAVFPPYARYCASKSINPQKAKGALIAVFIGERCHILDGITFLDIYATLEGLKEDALKARVRSWQA